jgi:phenylacetic acid degradation operon negative regulatory protein
LLFTVLGERIYGFTASAPQWDGKLLMVLVRVPESERPARHLLRTRLAWAGPGSPMPGVWIGTHTDRMGQVEDVLKQVGVFDDARTFVSEYRSGAGLDGLIQQAWDLPQLEDAYDEFLRVPQATASRGLGRRV